MPSTIRLHRVLQAPPDRIYRAFLDPDAKAKCSRARFGQVHQRMPDSAANTRCRLQISRLNSHSFGGKDVELVPNELLRYTDTFAIKPAGRMG